MTLLYSQEGRRIRKPQFAATTSLHPASCILVYLLVALAIPGMPLFMLPVPLLPALILLILRQSAPLRLVWRTRWLLLVLLLGYAYSLPGDPLWQALGTFSPSREGGVHGIEQAVRLLILLLWLDILVLGQPAEVLLAGLHQLLQPLSWIGIDPKPAALRLGLTLRAIEGMERGRGNLYALFKLDFQADLPEKLEIRLQPLRPLDVALPGLAAIGLILAWLS